MTVDPQAAAARILHAIADCDDCGVQWPRLCMAHSTDIEDWTDTVQIWEASTRPPFHEEAS